MKVREALRKITRIELYNWMFFFGILLIIAALLASILEQYHIIKLPVLFPQFKPWLNKPLVQATLGDVLGLEMLAIAFFLWFRGGK
jgi:hypothetical protein